MSVQEIQLLASQMDSVDLSSLDLSSLDLSALQGLSRLQVDWSRLLILLTSVEPLGANTSLSSFLLQSHLATLQKATLS